MDNISSKWESKADAIKIMCDLNMHPNSPTHHFLQCHVIIQTECSFAFTHSVDVIELEHSSAIS